MIPRASTGRHWRGRDGCFLGDLSWASLADFGKLVGMSVANLCDIEKGRRDVSPEKAEQVAKAIGVPCALLVRLSIEESLRAAGLRCTVEIKPAA